MCKPSHNLELQPCPHCGVETTRCWVEDENGNERYFVQHGLPICRFGIERTEAFLFTDKQIKAFKEIAAYCKYGLQTNCHLCKYDRTSQYFWLGYAGIVCIVCLVFYYFIGVGK